MNSWLTERSTRLGWHTRRIMLHENDIPKKTGDTAIMMRFLLTRMLTSILTSLLTSKLHSIILIILTNLVVSFTGLAEKWRIFFLLWSTWLSLRDNFFHSHQENTLNSSACMSVWLCEYTCALYHEQITTRKRERERERLTHKKWDKKKRGVKRVMLCTQTFERKSLCGFSCFVYSAGKPEIFCSICFFGEYLRIWDEFQGDCFVGMEGWVGGMSRESSLSWRWFSPKVSMERTLLFPNRR